MKIIAVIGQKGGTGKTTLTTGLAVAASLAGKQSAIIDLDPQTNAANWKDRREAESGPAVVSVQVGRLRHALEAAREAGAAYVFIDTAGKSDTAAIESAKVADFVLVPARMQVFDLETLAAVRDILRFAGDPPAAVVINGAHPNAKNPAEAAEEIREGFGIAVAPVALSHRAAYANAPATGQGPQELEPNGKAAKELAALFAFVEKSTSGKIHNSTAKAVRS